MIQSDIAEMATAIEASRALVYEAAYSMDRSLPSNRLAAIAKFHASQTAKLCADKAMQIFGGYGLAREYRVSWLKSYADLFSPARDRPTCRRSSLPRMPSATRSPIVITAGPDCVTFGRTTWSTDPSGGECEC
jgi:hypothetical protein